MVFTSHIFIFYFLPATLLIYYLLPAKRNFFLLLVSYAFYGWWNPWFVALMFAATLINYLCGAVIARSEDQSPRRKWALILSVTASLSILGFFKYFVFLQSNISALVELFGAAALPIWKVTLPVGISFYIFQSMTYAIDVYRREAPPARSFWDFACFVALFPQLIAGPILRYNTIAEQLVSRDHTHDRFARGVAIFILGFAKKILLANPLGQIADAAFGAQAPYALDAWFGIIAYAFQIYYDFSGYSDMAVGLGRMFGFEFMKNFNAPYLSDSITDFWRRWHISLSTFLRDYLYIPLGGNRKSARRTYFNLWVVMLLGGLWHGANWTFVLWGAYHGGLLAYERWRGKESLYSWFPRPCRISITFVLVLFSWVLFRAPDFGAALGYFAAMFGLAGIHGGSILLAAELYTPSNLFILVLCAFFAWQPKQAFEFCDNVTLPKALLLIVVFGMALATMFVQSFNPFLYFQF